MSGSARRPPLLAKTTTSSGNLSRSSGDSPSPPTNHANSPPPSEQRSDTRTKRVLIESACSACRRRKSRVSRPATQFLKIHSHVIISLTAPVSLQCDGMRFVFVIVVVVVVVLIPLAPYRRAWIPLTFGDRPVCSRCQALRSECVWEAEEGESRWSALRRRNQLLETERIELRELLSHLRSRPPPEAAEIYHRLRTLSDDEDILTILYQVRDGELSTTSPGPVTASIVNRHSPSSNGSVHEYQPPPPPPPPLLHPAPPPPRLPPIRTILDIAEIPHRPGPVPPLLSNLGTADSGSRSRDPCNRTKILFDDSVPFARP